MKFMKAKGLNVDNVATGLFAKDKLKFVSIGDLSKAVYEKLKIRNEEKIEVFLEYFDYMLLQLPNEKTGKKEIFSDFEYKPISLQRTNKVFEIWISDHNRNKTEQKPPITELLWLNPRIKIKNIT